MNQEAPPTLASPLDEGFSEMASVPQSYHPPAPLDGGGSFQAGSFGSVIVAQRVPVKRNTQEVLQRLKVLAATSGGAYVYSWQVNDKRNNRKVTIEGPTIKLANDLAREYGNCVVETRAVDTGEHWMIYARFTDIETGYSLTRPFQQRKSQSAGKNMDADRQMDLAFQIGVSKAIRNVTINALQTFADYVVEEANRSVINQVTNQKEKVWQFIEKTMERHNITLKQVEATVGRVEKDWTVRDLTRVYMEMRGIHEGLTSAKEAYPSPEDAATVMERNKEANAAPNDDADNVDDSGDGKDKSGQSDKKDAETGGKSTDQGGPEKGAEASDAAKAADDPKGSKPKKTDTAKKDAPKKGGLFKDD